MAAAATIRILLIRSDYAPASPTPIDRSSRRRPGELTILKACEAFHRQGRSSSLYSFAMGARVTKDDYAGNHMIMSSAPALDNVSSINDDNGQHRAGRTTGILAIEHVVVAPRRTRRYDSRTAAGHRSRPCAVGRTTGSALRHPLECGAVANF